MPKSNKVATLQFVVVVGDFAKGHKIYGPVRTVAEGHEIGEAIVGEEGEWIVMPIIKVTASRMLIKKLQRYNKKN